MKTQSRMAAVALLGLAACGPRMQPVRPVVANGATIPTRTEETVARARAEGEAERARLADERDRSTVAALASCAGATCEAMGRGELTIGMTEPQLYAATGTTASAWERRGSGELATLAALYADQAPRDRVAEIAFVTLRNGRVWSYTYREPEGPRQVSSAAQAGRDAQTQARADALLREGDDFAARGAFVRALDRYDRADVIRPGDARTTLAIARALDKQLRPVEARLRYLQFLNQMEIERIRAGGDAYANMAAAIAEARARIVVIERGGR